MAVDNFNFGFTNFCKFKLVVAYMSTCAGYSAAQSDVLLTEPCRGFGSLDVCVLINYVIPK